MAIYGAEKQEALWLSVVIIGRNEADNLPALFASLPGGDGVEWIYIDSNSEDESAELARQAGADVYIVDKDSVYGPGTGRYIGTKEAKGSWILYLDGDMRLRPDFRKFLERLWEAGKLDEQPLPLKTTAFVGRTINFLYDKEGRLCGERDYVVLSRREMGDADHWGKEARYHGGAVLYIRNAVLEAGNWNPAVYQLEELDLLSRVRARGGVIRAIDLPMAEHHTTMLSLSERLKLNFYAQYRSKYLYGLGQVVSARLQEGELFSLVRNYPQPFILLGGLLAAIPLYFIWPPLPVILNLAIAAWFGLTKKWYFYLVYLGNLLQIFRGLGRYRRFEPQYYKLNNPNN